MDIFPIPAANAPVRATGTKPPQSDSATDAATHFANGITGKNGNDKFAEAGAPPEVSPAPANENNAANPTALQLSNPADQLVASLAVGEDVTPPPGGESPLAPASGLIEILQGETSVSPPVAQPATTGDLPVTEGQTGNVTNPITTGDGNVISQAAIDAAPAPQGRPAGNSGENSANNGAPTPNQSGNFQTNPNAGQVPRNIAAGIPDIPVETPQVAAIVPHSVNAAAQATQASAQGAAQAAGLQPLPTEQTGSRAAAQSKSATTPNRSANSNSANGNANSNGNNGVNQAANGIPSAIQAQNAPGQAIANAAISGQPVNAQQAAHATPPAPNFDTLLPGAGVGPELTPTTIASLNAAGISGVGTDTRAAALQGARAMPPQHPVEQVAVQITQAVQSGADKITVQLRPESLGRITVELELGADSKVTAIISAEKQDTLDLMQRDSRALEKALNEAGLKTDPGSLSFNLRGDGDHPEAGESDGQVTNAAVDVPVEDDAVAQISPYDQSRSIGLDGGINIRV